MAAIHITINAEPINMPPVAPEASAKDLIEALTATHVTPQGQVLSTIHINGQYWQRDWDGHLEDIGLEEIEAVELTSQPPQQAADQGLECLEEVIELMETRFIDSAEDLRFNRMDEGLQKFIHGAGLMRDALHFGQLYLDHIQAPEDHPERKRLGELDMDLSGVLDEFDAAQRAGDWNQVADLIEYELAPRACELSLNIQAH